MLELSQELLLRRRQEEKEARDLESMVQSVEQNLQLMTVRLLMRTKNKRRRIIGEIAYYSNDTVEKIEDCIEYKQIK